MKKNNLDTLREKIDKIDKDILKLIQKRGNLAINVGDIKSSDEPGKTLYKPERESKILRSVIEGNSGPISNERIRVIYKELISACLSLEEGLKVGYLGPEGTHSEAAVLNHFGSKINRLPNSTIDDVFYQVLNKEINLGVVPVENSSEGVINTTLNCLADNKDIYITGEIYLNINHQLAGSKKFNVKDAIAIASHPQALGQCNKWIERNIGSIKRLEMSSSAEAAKYAKENSNILCIVNHLAVSKYKLKVINENIQDYSENKTRFLVVGREKVGKTGNDKTSMLIQTENNPGALLGVLSPFEEKNINLSKIETRPSRDIANSHDFFIDCEGHQLDSKLKTVIKKIKDSGASVRLLGSYPDFI